MRPKDIRSPLKQAGLRLHKISHRIDGGADGNIYQYGKEKILKISNGLRMKAKDVYPRMRYITRPRKCVVRIYKWGKYKDEFSEGYWLLMEKLKPISRNMDEFFTTFRDNEQVSSYLEYNTSSLEEFICSRKCVGFGDTLGLWGKLLPKEQKQIKQFFYLLRRMKWWHEDLHGSNVMQDKIGNLKMIDVESIMPKYKHYDYWSH